MKCRVEETFLSLVLSLTQYMTELGNVTIVSNTQDFKIRPKLSRCTLHVLVLIAECTSIFSEKESAVNH